MNIFKTFKLYLLLLIGLSLSAPSMIIAQVELNSVVDQQTLSQSLSESQIQQLKKLQNNQGDEQKELVLDDQKNKSKDVDLNAKNEVSKLETQFDSIVRQSINNDLGYAPFLDNDDKLSEADTANNIQFGYDIFNKKFDQSSTFTNIPVDSEYVLGPKDEIIINIWGKLEEKFNQIIDNNGKIYIPKVGELYLAGQTLAEARETIKSELEKSFVNFEISITMGRLRSIKVFVLGEVKYPGSYDISSLSTLLTGLYVSGGVTKRGSLRKVELIRNSKTIRTIDLYDFLISGKNKNDLQLESYDTIFVPVIGDVINVVGEVKRPAIFEIEKNTTLYDSIYKYAGGTSQSYYYKRIQLQRIVDGERYLVKDINVTKKNRFIKTMKSTMLQNGDIVTVLPVLDTTYQKVTISGSINRPGSYQFKQEMTLSELIETADNYPSATYLKNINIFRLSGDTERKLISIDYTATQNMNFELSEFDIVKLYSNQDVLGFDQVSIQGAVRKAGEYELLKNMTVKDLVFMSSPLDSANVNQLEIRRKNDDLSMTILEINLENKDQSNILLQKNDIVFVKNDNKILSDNFVKITGQVRFPGTYSIKAGEKINDIIERAGGLLPEAFIKGLVFRRESVNDFLRSGEEKIIKEEQRRVLLNKELVDQLDTKSKNNVEVSKTFINEALNESDKRIVLNIDNWQKFKMSRSNILLENNDNIYIPVEPSTVQVLGGVENPSAYLFENGEDAQFYIEKSGSFTDYAMKKKVMVFKANGQVDRELKNIELGDTIYVPEKIKVQRDYLQTIVKVTQVLANIATTLLLINNIQ